MNIPSWFVSFLEDHFTANQVAVIAGNWYRYNQISLGNSTREELLGAARAILTIRQA